MTSDEQFMSEAIKEARTAKAAGDLPFGAIIVCDDEVVGKGRCENNTTGDVTDHAELMALREACRTLKRNELKDCTIYCTNEPCPMCAAGIFQAKISNLVIGLTRSDLPGLLRPRKILMKDLADDSGYQVSITTGICKEEILKEFSDVKK
jgi:tRNA(adenine34) deaminase